MKKKHSSSELKNSSIQPDDQKSNDLNYKAIFENSPEVIVFVDTNGVVQDVNQRVAEWLNFDPAEIRGKHFSDLDFISDETRWSLGEKFQSRLKGEKIQPYTLELIDKNGERKVGQVVARTLKNDNGAVTGSLMMISDITAQYSQTMHLMETSDRYRALLDDNIDAVLIFDLEGVILEVNRKVMETFGYRKEEITGEHISRLVVPEELQESRDRLERLLTGEEFPVYERTFRRNDGTEFIGEINVSLVKDSGGNPTHFQSIVRDVTERKQAALDIEKRKKYLESFLHNIPEAVVILDSRHRVVEWNPGAEKLFGYTKEEVSGKDSDDLITDSSTKSEANDFTRSVQSGDIIYSREIVRYRKDGTPVNVLLSASPVEIWGELEGIVAVYTDITLQKKIEEEMKKADKLDSLGLLAGGIAHDFNNILASISVNLGLFDLQNDDRAKQSEKLKRMEIAVSRARGLTQQLLSFSEGNAPVKTPASMGEFLKETVAFALSGSNVTCNFSIPEELWGIEMDEGQISQVIQNIAINAVQAMPEGGNIDVTASNVEYGDLIDLPLKEGNYLRIDIRDNGHGIPDSHLEKIFDPFFTTKQKGGGLGLATSFSIVKNHDGLITVESELGTSTTFSIYLPALGRKIAKSEKEPLYVAPGGGKVLLMDDDELILDATGELLRHIGYQVVKSRDGKEAVRLYREAMNTDSPFDCLILDLTIPDGMGGRETIDRLLKFDPGVKAIASSGYSVDPIISDFRSYGFSGAVAKPYDIETLSRVLNKVISPSGS